MSYRDFTRNSRYNSWSTTQIVATVPDSVPNGTGPVTVTVNSIISNSNVTFTAVNPVITNLSPSSGAPGGTVFVNGTGFGAWNGQVYFNGLTAYILSWSDTSIKVWVPSGATTGPVTVVESGVTSGGVQFNVEGPPIISAISPAVGGVGWPVTITGTGFGSAPGSSIVTFNGLSAATTSWSDTQIVATVPSGAVSGPVGMTVASLGTEGPAFTISNAVYLKDTFGNQSIYTSQDVGGAWNITEAQGSGCSTCTIRGNTQWTYDTSGDVLSVVDANNHTTSYTYDTASNMLSQSAQSDAGTVTTSYTYNSLNEVLTITDPLGHITTNTYDAKGNLLTVTTPSPDGGGMINRELSGQMQALLHLPAFQALEAAWRSLFFLVRRVETRTALKLYLIDISKEDLDADLASLQDLRATGAYKLIVEKTVGTQGAEPWALIVGNYTFGPHRKDAELLGRLARIARAAGAPFIGAASPRLLRCDSLAGTPHPRDWQWAPDADGAAAWAALRRLPEADAIGLVLPRFLLRLPYGKKTDPIQSFDFEEMPESPSHEDYIWGNPAFAFAVLLAQSFSEYGWEMRPGMHAQIDGLPLHVYEQEGESESKPCAEVLLTDDAAESILENGLMPLASLKGTDSVRLVRFQSVTDPLQELEHF